MHVAFQNATCINVLLHAFLHTPFICGVIWDYSTRRACDYLKQRTCGYTHMRAHTACSVQVRRLAVNTQWQQLCIQSSRCDAVERKMCHSVHHTPRKMMYRLVVVHQSVMFICRSCEWRRTCSPFIILKVIVHPDLCPYNRWDTGKPDLNITEI